MRSDAQHIDLRPVCAAVGTRSEGWYQSGIRVQYAPCAGCVSYCSAIDTPQEGWYNWCDRSLITTDRCGSSLHTFTDVPERHPLYPAIRHAVTLGIVEGYSVPQRGMETWEYRPQAPINRAEFTKIIIAAIFDRESIAACEDVRFSDVDGVAWYAPFVCIASEMNVVQGHPDGSFRPGHSINFAEAAAVVARAFKLPMQPAVDGDPWYRGPVEALAVRQAIPQSIASFDHRLTRGEMADILHRVQVPDPPRPSHTYAALVALSTPSASSAASSPPPPVPRTRIVHAGGLFSLALPSHWQALMPDGTRVPLSVIDERFVSYGSPDAAEASVAVEVLDATAMRKPAGEAFFPFLRRTVVPPVEDDAIETISYADWTLYIVRQHTGAYTAFFIHEDTAVLLSFAAETAESTGTVASFQWTVLSSTSSAASVSPMSSEFSAESFPSSAATSSAAPVQPASAASLSSAG